MLLRSLYYIPLSWSLYRLGLISTHIRAYTTHVPRLYCAVSIVNMVCGRRHNVECYCQHAINRHTQCLRVAFSPGNCATLSTCHLRNCGLHIDHERIYFYLFLFFLCLLNKALFATKWQHQARKR